MVLFCLVTLITQYWKIPGIITKIFSVLFSVILVVGCVYINSTRKAISNISGSRTQETQMGVYVLADNPANSIAEIKDAPFGIIANIDRKTTDKTIDNIEKEISAQITIVEYDGTAQVIDALLGGNVTAIIINQSYINILSEHDDYKDLDTKVKLLSTYKQINEVNNNNVPDNAPSKEGVFTVYVSGIDTKGAPTVNQNSDVNILITVNTNTHQILMINTPRDFYVPLSISNGVNDKLTHAGCYGIDCSVDTVEMLYGINIDHYLKVNFTGFVNIIDALNGVDIYSEYEFTTIHGGYHYVQGYNHLNGIQALGFARERYSFGSGDRQRGKNQMAVIKATLNKMMTSDMLMNYTSVLNAVSASMATDMSYDEISSLVKMQLETMPEWDIQSFSVDGTGDNLPCFSLSSPNYVMIPNEETVNRAKAYLRDIYNDIIINTAS
ncbi:MAG: LCP family protein [Butyrivibrio sp.]|nr:LCP family protein [Butyrivibrio sp.]